MNLKRREFCQNPTDTPDRGTWFLGPATGTGRAAGLILPPLLFLIDCSDSCLETWKGVPRQAQLLGPCDQSNDAVLEKPSKEIWKEGKRNTSCRMRRSPLSWNEDKRR